MSGALGALVAVVAGSVLLIGLVRLVMVPFAIAFELAHRPPPGSAATVGATFVTKPFVSVIVPAFDEAPVIDRCVRSIARSDYPSFEVICVDDGSDDDTLARLHGLAAELGRVTVIGQPNRGKGAALNRGIAVSRGEIVLLVDADGIFLRDTISELVRAFADDRVGAVCGDDRPVNLDRVQTRLLALIAHLGTGMVRRALHVWRAIPVVSGNIGAYRRDVLDECGGLREDTLGEDLELTWRVQRAGHRVTFAPRAQVYAESPSTAADLWRQRVRWARGLLQAMHLHRDMIGNPRHGAFGLYLAVNSFAQVVVPVVQVVSMLTLAVLAIVAGPGHLPDGTWAWALFLGLPLSVALLVVALALDRAPGDLRFFWTLPLWPVYSTGLTVAMLWAIWLEARRKQHRWSKPRRTGTVSRAHSGG